MFDTSIYSLAVIAHAAAATVLVGSSMLAPFTRKAVVDARSLADLQVWLDFGRRSTQANPVAAFVVLGTGIYLGSYGWWAHPWFYVAVAAWAINAALAVGVVERTARAIGAAAARAAENRIPPDVEALRRSAAWPVANAAMRAMDLAILYVMFDKPPLAESCIVVGGAAALFVAVALVRERRQMARMTAEPVPA